MNGDKEPFVSRWSRLKTEAREAPKEAESRTEELVERPPQAPVELPKVENLTPESDFTPFMDPRVDGETRRAALKKLFADARFNVPDPYEAYSEDYTAGEPIPMEVLKTLNQARRIVFDEPEKVAQAPEPKPAIDDAGRQDT